MEFRSLIKDIIYNDIFKNAINGELKLEFKEDNGVFEYIFNVGFNTILNGKIIGKNINNPTLCVSKEEEFIDLLEEYVKECDKYPNFFSSQDFKTRIKGYLIELFPNALYEDFSNPYDFIKRTINFYKNPLPFEELNYSSEISLLDNSNIMIYNKLQDIRMETPYAFTPIIENGEDTFILPTISYGISNDICYIYTSQNKGKIETPYQRKINRSLYKLNEKVLDDETSEYQEFKNGDWYYPENISDVSPSSILSLSIFLDVISSYGIKNVKIISLLPIRYTSKELTTEKNVNIFLIKII